MLPMVMMSPPVLLAAWIAVAGLVAWVLVAPIQNETFASHIWGQPGAQPWQQPVYARRGQNMQNMRQSGNMAEAGFVPLTYA